MRDDTVHLFYQTYGNNEKDAICHAWSTDGIHFERDASNPIFAPEPAAWTCGRAIDAEVARVGDRYLMYYATRTTDYKRQIIGVAEAPADTDFSRGEWRQVGDGPVLKPEYPWEETCTEGASIVEHDGKYYMFYAGAYNNRPQQVGVAVSDDGIRWTIDDALKYVTRQVRRGATFDGIILDPPAYGRGPDGERWKLDECLNDILKGCARILAPMNSFLVLNLYSNGYSAMLADTLVACAFGPAGRRTSGELVLKDDSGRILPLSVYTRLER